MKKALVIILAVSALACTSRSLKGPRPEQWAEKVTGKPFRNLYKVNDSIYRSEKPDNAGFHFFQDKKMASVLDLRRKHKDLLAVEGSSYKGNLYSIPMKTSQVSDKEIIAALRILKTAPKPIVVHCAHGSDRTGVTIAMYRIIFQNWNKEQAIEEMKRGNYNYHWFYPSLITYIRNADIESIRTQVLK
ncbi:tyrosine-protein phosphatase [Elizabethkingia meningoseptica]|uniref:tyrosine-protein phosphatase n=1 Tax=Elizabethkingia meningoseptica TaxID=238 RepID=UPI0008417EC9|nr:tyrosine-protein phosphatase [Elizabethkingia meningoseptica]MDE5526208.1 tyrosine-protein phosphatase [Elizabethkingia meningoseptica]ODM55519.1 protein tyrosine phosphatase [Elizabethkingia meningoseptica]OHT30725.1 protein tyrosine phosphatase [Elizabethkingia meningoseptica]OPC14839.1 protein tyrosine phosphatase [Elizabethkingia meningoseptica]